MLLFQGDSLLRICALTWENIYLFLLTRLHTSNGSPDHIYLSCSIHIFHTQFLFDHVYLRCWAGQGSNSGL